MLRVFYSDKHLEITLDSGATVSYLRYNQAIYLGIEILPNDQLALLADQKTRMASLGEVDFVVSFNGIQLRLRALVMKNLQADCFGGTTFHADNGIEAKIRDGTIILHGKYTVQQSNPILQLPLYPPPSETICATDTDFKRDMKPPPRNFNVARSYSSYPVKPPEDQQFNAISLPIEKMILPSEVLHIPISNKMPIASYLHPLRCNYSWDKQLKK